MEMTHTRQFLLTPPQDLPQAQPWGLPLVYMIGQLSPAGQFTAAPLPPEVRGGLLLVGVSEPPSGGADPRRAVRGILSLCQARRFGRVVLDIEGPPTPYLARLIRLLDEGLSQHTKQDSGGWLYLPEAYGGYSKRAFLYCTAAVSGGSLRHRLEGLIARWGKHRLVLCLRRTREDFFLPAPTGCGKPLSPEDLTNLRRQFEPSVFYSRDLCAHYFTYMSRSTGAHFVLFDDAESLRQKRALAQELGIGQFFLLYPEVADLLPELLDSSDAKTPCP